LAVIATSPCPNLLPPRASLRVRSGSSSSASLAIAPIGRANRAARLRLVFLLDQASTNAANVLDGRGGNDTIDGGRISGTDGNDAMDGRGGDDWLNGNGGNDRMLGGRARSPAHPSV